MIAASELRMGNWVMYGDSEILKPEFRNKHYQLSPTDLGWVFSNLNTKMYNPIPLTPEILVACGFKLETKVWWIFPEEDISGLVLLDNSPTDESFSLCAYDQLVLGTSLIKYLHQLQNLYYSLTGTELNYQP